MRKRRKILAVALLLAVLPIGYLTQFLEPAIWTMILIGYVLFAMIIINVDLGGM